MLRQRTGRWWLVYLRSPFEDGESICNSLYNDGAAIARILSDFIVVRVLFDFFDVAKREWSL
jgi:hypothetical protein